MEAELVCPRCGSPAGQRPYCSNCGLNLLEQDELPSAEQWRARGGPGAQATVSRHHEQEIPAASTPGSSAPTDGQRAPARATHGLIATRRFVVVRWIWASSVGLAVGSVGTWATASVFGLTESASGLRGGGWVTLFVAIGVSVLTLEPGWLGRAGWVHRHRRGLMIGLAALAIVICVLNLTSVQSSGLSGIVHPGWGLYLALVASISLALWSYVLRVQERSGLDDA